MLADDTGMAAAGGTDPGCIAQQLDSLGKLLIIKIILHFRNAGSFNIISSLCSGNCFILNHNNAS